MVMIVVPEAGGDNKNNIERRRKQKMHDIFGRRAAAACHCRDLFSVVSLRRIYVRISSSSHHLQPHKGRALLRPTPFVLAVRRILSKKDPS